MPEFSNPSTNLHQIRRTWDDTWIGVALRIAERSLCSRSQVGCVVVDASQRILATGYNGPPRAFEHGGLPCGTGWCHRAVAPPDQRDALYDDCPSLHAEANAISVGDRNHRNDGTIYVTSHVCFGCAKLIANSGIMRVVVQPDAPAPYRDPNRSYDFLRDLGIGVKIVIR
jgi:deoxycytidylate deaminase